MDRKMRLEKEPCGNGGKVNAARSKIAGISGQAGSDDGEQETEGG